MECRILLGLGLDGAAPGKMDGLGFARMGPRAFLDFLETHTGLYRPSFPSVERQAVFLGVLRGMKDGLGSFKVSFDIDPFATAKELLRWLDGLLLHGWDGSLPGKAPPRIVELHSLLEAARGIVPPSEAERVNDVRRALEAGARTPLSRLELCEPVEEHPLAWRRLLGLLPHEVRTYAPMAPPASDLGRLQAFLSGGKEEAWKGDGSLVFREASTAIAAARLLFSEAQKNEDDRIIIAGEGAALLDEMAMGQGAPHPAAGLGSSEKPGLQLLPLALNRHRDPLDLEGMLSFLCHPLSPLGRDGMRLAEAIAADGGVGGPNWLEAVERLEERLKEKGSKANAAETIGAWLPAKRCPPNGMDVEYLVETTERLSSYARARLYGRSDLPDPERFAFEDALAHCALFTRTLKRLGRWAGGLPDALVDDLLLECAASMGSMSGDGPQLGSIHCVSDPEEVVEPIERELWFLPDLPPAPVPWPWSSAEISTLNRRGLSLPSAAELGARASKAWIRALNLATREIVLVVPPDRDEQHPLALLIRSLWKNVPRESVENALLSSGRKNAVRLPYIHLPSLQRFWHIGADLSPSPGWRASYSQLETFIYRPAQWILEHKARIRPSTVLSLPDPVAQKGTLAHAIIQELIDEFGVGIVDLDEKKIDAWYGTVFKKFLETRGGPFLAAGSGHMRLRLEAEVRSSIIALVRQLSLAGITKVEAEKQLKGEIFGHPFSGLADIVFRDGKGRSCLIDMKYSRWNRGYWEKLGMGTDIQLSIYAELLRQVEERKSVPAAAYWLIPLEKMLACDRGRFPGADIVDCPYDREERLSMIEKSLKWRKALLAAGDVEVVCEGTDDSESAASPPDGALPVSEVYDGFDPYLSLYGWSEAE